MWFLRQSSNRFFLMISRLDPSIQDAIARQTKSCLAVLHDGPIWILFERQR
jgi:hypothetical protein